MKSSRRDPVLPPELPPRKQYIDGRKPPERAVEKIVYHLRRCDCPTYLGALSVSAGVSLSQAVAIMNYLVDENIVHELDRDEKPHVPEDHSLWILTPLGKEYGTKIVRAGGPGQLREAKG